MIKCNVNVCGVICYSAITKQNKDGSDFLTFRLSIQFAGKDGSAAERTISVSAPINANKTEDFTTGRRVLVHGLLYIRKTGEEEYWNLRTDEPIKFIDSEDKDKIDGTMDFIGYIGKSKGKGIQDRVGKTGRPYQTFDASSYDHKDTGHKDNEGKPIIEKGWRWVHFINFNPVHEDFFQVGAYVEIAGELQISVFNTALNLQCQVNTIRQSGKKQ